MKDNQLTRGHERRVMYIENKDGTIDGAAARIGWVSFSRTGLSVHYRGRVLKRAKGRAVSGNYYDAASGEEYWVSGIKTRGSNTHPAESVKVHVDPDAREELERIRGRAR